MFQFRNFQFLALTYHYKSCQQEKKQNNYNNKHLFLYTYHILLCRFTKKGSSKVQP